MEAPFPPWFFERADPAPDRAFYDVPRLVTHLDEGAIAAVGQLYEELGLTGGVLDLMGSWISHFRRPPEHLTVLGLNAAELAANDQAAAAVVHDLNRDPVLPFASASFDAAVCCASVDYLVRPLAVFADLARVVRPGGVLVCTFSNRCFPTKAVAGWLHSDDAQRASVVAAYFGLAGGWGEAVAQLRTPAAHRGDPLWAVWARRAGDAPRRGAHPGHAGW